MEYAKVEGFSRPVSRLIMGTTKLDPAKQEEVNELLDEVYALGVNTFDTARVYGPGAEIALGGWIRARGLENQVNVITKGAHPDRVRKRVTRKDILEDCTSSLERLGLAKVEGYLLHRDDPDVAVGEILDILNGLKEQGKIDCFGGSNWTHQRIAEANEYAERHQMTGFTMSSPHYALAVQVVDPWGGNCVTIAGPDQEEARAFYRRTGMPVMAYSSLSHGFLSGRFRSDRPEDAEQVLDRFGMKGFAWPENFERLRRCEELAGKYGVKVPQIAMAWLLKQPENVFPVITVSKGERMRENIEAMSLPLTEEEVKYLNLEAE